MRRWLAVPVLGLAAVLAACGEGDDVLGDGEEEPVVTDEVGTAVEIARLSLPQTLGDDVVAGLVEDLCSAAGTGLVDPVVTELVASDINPDDLSGAVDALAAGASTYCPDDVDDVVPRVQQALSPATTLPATVAGEQGTEGAGAGSGSSARSSASSGSSGAGGGSTSGSASNSSSGSGSVGGGNATGTGNSSSTDFTQGAGSSSSNSSSSGGGSSSATTG